MENEVSPIVDSKPGTPTGQSVTDEELLSLRLIQVKSDRIKARLWDIERMAEQILAQKKQIETQQPELENRLVELQNGHQEYAKALEDAVTEHNSRVEEILQSYGIEAQNIMIDEDEPHEIRIL